jgi:hypothetical protein
VHASARESDFVCLLSLLLQMDATQLRTAIAADDCNKGLGICRTAQHKGKGWNSHGSVSCHSYG